jgi:hypothetical protein
MAEATYKPVVDFPGYRVGDDGSVWSCWRRRGRSGFGCRFEMDPTKWERMSPTPRRGAYLIVGLRRGGKSYYRQVHRLVLEAFIGPCPAGMQACHDPDHTPSNCRLGNLRWGTPASNCADRDRQGRTAKGERHGRAKLTAAAVRGARAAHAAGESLRSIARRTGLHHRSVSEAVRGVTWKSINPPGKRPGEGGGG